MKHDITSHRVTDFEFDAKDSQGRLWECRAQLTYELIKPDGHYSFGQPHVELDCLENLIGRVENANPEVFELFREIHPDAGMIRALKTSLRLNAEIIRTGEPVCV